VDGELDAVRSKIYGDGLFSACILVRCNDDAFSLRNLVI